MVYMFFGFQQNTMKLAGWGMKWQEKKWDAYLCITPPALREAEYLQSALGTLGCKREWEELSLKYRRKPILSH